MLITAAARFYRQLSVPQINRATLPAGSCREESGRITELAFDVERPQFSLAMTSEILSLCRDNPVWELPFQRTAVRSRVLYSRRTDFLFGLVYAV